MNWHYTSKRRSSSPVLGNNTVRYNDTLKDKKDKGIYCLINILHTNWHTIGIYYECVMLNRCQYQGDP